MPKTENATGAENILRTINAVKGFNPFELARTKVDPNDGTEYKSLDIKHQRSWFNLVHPKGRIEKVLVAHDATMAIIEAKIFDGEGNYLGNGFSQRFANPRDEKYGMAFLELTETYAESRALRAAGFDLHGILNTQSPSNEGADDSPISEVPEAIAPWPKPPPLSKEQSKPGPVQQSLLGVTTPIAPNPEVQEMAFETAMAHRVKFGKNKGKSLGEIVHAIGKASKAKEELLWYANVYSGPDQVLKQAAQCIIDVLDKESEKKLIEQGKDSNAAG